MYELHPYRGQQQYVYHSRRELNYYDRHQDGAQASHSLRCEPFAYQPRHPDKTESDHGGDKGMQDAQTQEKVRGR